VFDSAKGTLEGITDVETAKSSLPALTEMADNFGGLAGKMDGLPDAAKGPLAGIVKTGLDSILPLIEKVKAIPGVGAVIDPIIGPMMETLQGLAG